MELKKQEPLSESAENVRQGMILFMVVLKNMALYPPTNSIRHESMAKLRQWLDAFLPLENSLNLTVKRDRLLYQEEVVYLDRNDEKALIFPLYRDGVKWFEFHDGLPQKELEYFIDLMIRFRVLTDEAEDDVVTAMWDADFSFIKYKTADDFWGADGESEIVPNRVKELLEKHKTAASELDQETSQSKPLSDLFDECADPPGQPTAEADGAEADQSGDGPAQPHPDNVLVKDFGHISWQLSPKEEAYVKSMLELDRQRYTVHDSLEIILVLLKGIDREQDIQPLMEFMTEAIKNLLAPNEITRTREFLEKLRSMTGGGKPWIDALAAEVNKRIVSEEIIGQVLPETAPDPAGAAEFYQELYQLLLILVPEVVYALVPLLDRVADPYLERLFLTIIAFKAGQVGQAAIPVANALVRLKPAALIELTRLIRTNRLPWPTGFLETLGRHEQPQMRELALSILLEENPDSISNLAHLISDSQTGIRQVICAHLAKSRNAYSEKVLRDYLGGLLAQDGQHDEEHMLNCYRALGCCAIDQTQVLPFLRDILLKGGWRAMLGQGGESSHRQGAAIALMMLPSDWGANEILKKAAKSPFKAIRLACQAAEREMGGRANV